MQSGSSILAAIEWIELLITGRFATTIAVIAIAYIGLRMLLGQMPVRSAARILIGCFILFGAPTIARGLIGGLRGAEQKWVVAVEPIGFFASGNNSSAT